MWIRCSRVYDPTASRAPRPSLGEFRMSFSLLHSLTVHDERYPQAVSSHLYIIAQTFATVACRNRSALNTRPWKAPWQRGNCTTFGMILVRSAWHERRSD
ncbi:unnamed protein product [Leptosia nina]|uniref:Uncharacterized protein n=1 Tax=Leptosia nina TaxID=320188 RepID=A0AAV1JJY0_9NEOP